MPADCITSSYKQLHIMVGILDGVPAVVARFLAGVGKLCPTAIYRRTTGL